MADKLGILTTSPIGGISNSYLANGFYNFGGNWHPYSQSRSNASLLGRVNFHYPVNAPHRELLAQITPSYSDIFYHRLHLVPQRIDLGNVVSTQEFNLYAWNAHFQPKRLTAISGASEGITIEGKQPPYTYSPLEEQNYKVLVSPSGPSIINDIVIFNFTEESPSISITGNRVVAFSFMPNWAEDGITERLEWSTDILKSASGIEQRSALYLTPRRYFNGEFLIHASDKQRFNNMQSWGAKIWAIPLWPYIQQIKTALIAGESTILCATEDMEFSEGTLIILWCGANEYEVAEIKTVNKDSLTLVRPLLNEWPRGARLYPARVAEITKQPELTSKTDNLQTFSVEFRLAELSHFDAEAPESSYLNYPVLEIQPDWSEDLSSQYQRLLTTLDNGMALPRTTDTSGYSFYLQSYRWIGKGRAERAAYKSLLYFLNGQQKALWLPSFSDDLTPIGTINATEALISIEECGYSNFAKSDPDKKHIAIYTNDGRVFYRQIMNSEIRGTTERLSISAPLGKQILAKQIRRISYLRLCRSNSDSIEINHLTDSLGVARSNLTFTRVRDNEL